jgi:hypothetical protein
VTGFPFLSFTTTLTSTNRVFTRMAGAGACVPGVATSVAAPGAEGDACPIAWEPSPGANKNVSDAVATKSVSAAAHLRAKNNVAVTPILTPPR